MSEPVSDTLTVRPTRTTLLFVTAAAVVIVVGGIKAANHIVAPVMLSLSLVIVVHPLRARFERHMPRWAASIIVLITTVMLILSLAIAVAVSLGQLAKLIPTYATEMNGYVADVGEGLKNLGVGSDQSDSMVNSADVGRLVDLVTSILSSVLDTLTSLFFIVTLLAFLAFDSAKTERLAEGARRHRPYLVDAMASFARGTRSYLGVSAVFGLIVAVIDTALLYVLGVPGAFVWGVLAFVTNFIPNIGFIIGIIPPAIIALLEGGSEPDARGDRAVLPGQPGAPVLHPAPLRRRFRRAHDEPHVPVPHVLDLGARPGRRTARRADEPALPGDPHRGRSRGSVADALGQRDT